MRFYPATSFKRVLVLSLAIVSLSGFSVPPASAAGFWAAALSYSAQVNAVTLRAAKQSLRAAKGILVLAEADLDAARLNLVAVVTAGGTGAAVAAATAAVGNAAAAVAKAALAVTQLAAVESAAASLDAVTAIGEHADWVISACWDPLCDLSAVSPNYVYPDDAEIDSIYQNMMVDLGTIGFGATPAELPNHDLAIPGLGTTTLAAIRAVMRVNVIGLRGAAAFSAGGLCEDVLLAADDLAVAVAELGVSVEAFGTLLASSQTYIDDPKPDLEALTLSLVNVQTLVNEFNDPVAAQAAIDDLSAAVVEMENALAAVSKGDGSPMPFEGPEGLVPAMTLLEFQTFLSDVALNGESSLPPGEVAAMDTMLALLQIGIVAEVSSGPSLADYVGLGDTANEASLFSPDLLISDNLIESRAFRWDAIELCESPVVIGCGGPACPAAVPMSSPINRFLIVASVLGLAIFAATRVTRRRSAFSSGR